MRLRASPIRHTDCCVPLHASSQPCDHFNEFLLRLIPVLDFHLFRLVKTAKFGELLDGPELVGHPNFTNLRRNLVGLTET